MLTTPVLFKTGAKAKRQGRMNLFQNLDWGVWGLIVRSPRKAGQEQTHRGWVSETSLRKIIGTGSMNIPRGLACTLACRGRDVR